MDKEEKVLSYHPLRTFPHEEVQEYLVLLGQADICRAEAAQEIDSLMKAADKAYQEIPAAWRVGLRPTCYISKVV